MLEFHTTPIRFAARIPTRHPEVIKRRKMVTSDEYTFDTVMLKGSFYRVTPTSAREVFLLASLEKYEEKWAPAKGDGIIVRADVIDQVVRD
jgi:hypothetical protein